MVIEWVIGFLLGAFTTFFLTVVFDLRPFRRWGVGVKDPFKDAIARRLSSGPSIVAVGGGTGLSTLLRGMKAFTRNITAVVAVTDEGGSSGRLRTEWGVLPPGDVRNCMVALAENDNSLKQLLDFRFDRGELAGHSLGNLLLLAVSELCGDFRVAVEQMNHLLAIRGKVLPVTTEAIALVGLTEEGIRVRGELDISRNGSHLKEVWIEPPNARPVAEVLQAVDGAEMIVLGPGSLFTSVIPNLLLPDFSGRLRASSAPKVYVCNLMTQPEETEGMNILQHLEWVSAALGKIPEFIVVNSERIPDDIVEAYDREGAAPLYLDSSQRRELNRLGCTCIEVPMMRIMETRFLRHDSQKLAAVLFRLCRDLER